MNIANLLAAHGIGSGGFQKNSFVPLESAGFTTEWVTSFSSGSSTLDGGLTMDNEGNIYTVDTFRTIRKHVRTGSMLLSAQLPSSIANASYVHLEYCAQLDRIVCLDNSTLVVMDTSLNLLYNKPFPGQSSKIGARVFLVRDKFLYHVMVGNHISGRRMQKFDLSTLAYVYDENIDALGSARSLSSLAVDDQDNFYAMDDGNNLLKYDKLGNTLWSSPQYTTIHYLYFDKADQKLYITTSGGRTGYANLNTGTVKFVTGAASDVTLTLQGPRSRANPYDNGVCLMKWAGNGSNQYSHTLTVVYKNSVMWSISNIAQLVYTNNSYSVYSAASRKGYTAVVMQQALGQVHILKTGVKIV